MAAADIILAAMEDEVIPAAVKPMALSTMGTAAMATTAGKRSWVGVWAQKGPPRYTESGLGTSGDLEKEVNFELGRDYGHGQ